MPTPQQIQAKRLVDLKDQMTNLVKLRTEAESSVKFAQSQYDAVVERIAAMGIKPEEADTELAAINAELEALTGQLSQGMEAERQQYTAILVQTKTLLGGQK